MKSPYRIKHYIDLLKIFRKKTPQEHEDYSTLTEKIKTLQWVLEN